MTVTKASFEGERRCDSCGCLLPANTHGDEHNITHTMYLRGKLTRAMYEAAAKTKVGPGTVAKVKANIAKTEKLIAQGKLSPTKT